VPDLGPLRIEDPERLLLKGPRVGVDLLGREQRPQRRTATRIADPGRVVADDQDRDVAGGLELPQLLEHDHVAEVDVGGGRVDAELDAQRPARGEALLEHPGGQHVDRAEGQLGTRYATLGARSTHLGNARLTRRPGAPGSRG
jgi:hypothetical protein